MYVPHFDAILHALGTSRENLTGKKDVTIPVSLFKHLLQIALTQGEFNLAGYLAANRDVQEAAKKGQLPDPRAHYIGYGFFEGRRGALPAVDESWYRRTYADIAAAIRKGEVTSGAEHFNSTGAAEFRAPTADYEADAIDWKRAFGKL